MSTDNTSKYTWKQRDKNKLLHLFFDDTLVVKRASI